MGLDLDNIKAFQAESEGIIIELDRLVEDLESCTLGVFPQAKFEEFCEKVHQMQEMSQALLLLAPEHVSLLFIANTAQMCKAVGQEVAASRKANLLPFFGAFWWEAVEMLREVLGGLSDRGAKPFVEAHSVHFERRLKWLTDKVNSI